MIEHMLHLFFDCKFAVDCWSCVNLSFDMSEVDFAPSWLLDKLGGASTDELVTICMVLWGFGVGATKRYGIITLSQTRSCFCYGGELQTSHQLERSKECCSKYDTDRSAQRKQSND